MAKRNSPWPKTMKFGGKTFKFGGSTSNQSHARSNGKAIKKRARSAGNDSEFRIVKSKTRALKFGLYTRLITK